MTNGLRVDVKPQRAGWAILHIYGDSTKDQDNLFSEGIGVPFSFLSHFLFQLGL